MQPVTPLKQRLQHPLPGATQRGAALAVSLILTTVATMLGIASMSGSQTSERIAANQRQASEAFMAAETGLSSALIGIRNETLSFSDLGGGISGTVNAHTSWDAQVVGSSTLQSTGFVRNEGETLASRTIQVDVTQDGKLAPINIIGRIGENFDPASSNRFSVKGEKDAAGNPLGPAIATNKLTADELERFETELQEQSFPRSDIGQFCDWILQEVKDNQNRDLSERTPIPNEYRIECEIREVGQLDSYDGGIRAIDFDAPFGDPEALINFIALIEDSYCRNNYDRGRAPLGGGQYQAGYECQENEKGLLEIHTLASPDQPMGAEGMGCMNENEYDLSCQPKITIWDSELEGENLTLQGRPQGNDDSDRSGAGVLLVKGNLHFSGTPSFDGLVIVTGQKFSISGGGHGGVLGSIVFANPQKIVGDDETEYWAFDDAEAEFDFELEVDGGGSATFQYDEESLRRARNLIGEEAQQQWTPEKSTVSFSNWREVW